MLNFIVIKFNGEVQLVINKIQSNIQRRNNGESFANLVPFRTIETYISDLSFSVAFMNIFGNIIPFIPLGFLIPMAFPSRRNLIKTMISCFLIIISVETLQLILLLGIFDIDDIILNLLSCFIGFILFKAYKKIFKVVS
ncbi:VanZ family protein [Solibacillus sp. FSL K6-4121]|uniref:VanZ family protein n=1 Tax=Solibacillus sp. FSL K6-4121 TaxID=2921505 RepID=UPI004046F262